MWFRAWALYFVVSFSFPKVHVRTIDLEFLRYAVFPRMEVYIVAFWLRLLRVHAQAIVFLSRISVRRPYFSRPHIWG